MIAALFVERPGVYFGLPDVDPWDIKRDARLYAGPYPVVCHPPCERWGRYWSGGPSARIRREKGADAGCFASAIASVRRWRGVLEHPEGSHAWRAVGLFTPPKGGGWIVADEQGGWTCCVEQGHYGHRARKATWLYAVGVELPSLRWGRSSAKVRMDHGYHPPRELSADPRGQRKAWLQRCSADQSRAPSALDRMGKQERAGTPIPFRDLLLFIVGSANSRAGRA
jgi:hypothetical protein